MNRDATNVFWYWFQPALGVVLGGLSIYTLVMLLAAEAYGIPSIQFGIDGAFVFPGLLLSIGTNQLILRRRNPRIVTLAERILLGVIAGIVVLLVVTSVDQMAFAVGIFVWPVLILVAIATTAVIAVKTSTLAAPVPVVPVPEGATAYGAAPTTQAEPEDPLDELFAGGKD